MKVKTIDSLKMVGKVRTFSRRFLVLAVAAMFFQAPSVAESGPSGGPAKPSTAVKFEEIPNSKVKRVILTEKAAERLGIEIGKVSEAVITRKQMVGGRVIPPVNTQPTSGPGRGGFGGFGKVAMKSQLSAGSSSGSGESWVEVTLSEREWERLDKSEPARVMSLATRDQSGKAVLAQLSDKEPVLDSKRTMLKVYYKLPGKDHGMTMYHRVRVELPIVGIKEKQKVVPYSSVYYDGKGVSWVYANLKPLTYERKQIKIKRIEGGLAVLDDGPSVGTPVVIVGSAMLFGAEVIFKR